MSEAAVCGTKSSLWLKIFGFLILLIPTLGGGALVWLAVASAPGELHSRLGVGIGGGVLALLFPVAAAFGLMRRKRKYGTFKQTEEERVAIRAKGCQQKPQPMALRIALPLMWIGLAVLSTYKGLHAHTADDMRWFMAGMYWVNAVLWTGLAVRKQPPGDPAAPISLNLNKD